MRVPQAQGLQGGPATTLEIFSKIFGLLKRQLDRICQTLAIPISSPLHAFLECQRTPLILHHDHTSAPVGMYERVGSW